jgi:hypothetical protein
MHFVIFVQKIECLAVVRLIADVSVWTAWKQRMKRASFMFYIEHAHAGARQQLEEVVFRLQACC